MLKHNSFLLPCQIFWALFFLLHINSSASGKGLHRHSLSLRLVFLTENKNWLKPFRKALSLSSVFILQTTNIKSAGSRQVSVSWALCFYTYEDD